MRHAHVRPCLCAFILTTLTTSIFFPVSAWAEGIWRAADDRTSAPPGVARFLALPDALRAVLGQAPQEFSAAAAAAPVKLPLPMPEGTLASYAVEASPILQRGIAARYPEIRSYSLRALDGRGHGRLTWTPAGAHALIATEGGLVHLAPVGDAAGAYQSFYDRAGAARQPVQCQAGAAGAPSLRSLGGDASTGPLSIHPPASSGDTLRVYRLAVSTTGEYYAGRGGTDASVLASIVTEIDKVNVVYETEAAIRLVLIDDTDQLFFTDPDTDGYSNADPCSMRVENQGIVDGILDDDEYDIGMVFGTSPGGGCASQGVCVSGAKATGAAGLNVGLPVGHENFGGYRLVGHEMGHQFSASHTFSGSQGNCTAGQFSPSTAWEPGGGTTLMSYSGTCGSDNIQSAVEDTYLHTGSFDQVVAYTTTGSGDCAQQIATGNGAPTVDAGPDYTIPRQTPFVLTGSAVDPDGDPLTYAWEQLDVAAGQGPPNVDDGVGPLFRSFPPTASPERTLPQISDLLANTTTVGELLPSVEGRILTFRLTARDDRAGGGGVDHDTAVLTVSGDPFRLLAPNGGESLHAGCTADVSWEVGGGSIADQVDLLVSGDDGASFEDLFPGAANDGAQPVTLPCQAAAAARVEARAVGNIFFDISDAPFAVVAEPPAVEVSADGGEVDDACAFELPFEATVVDDCAVAAGDVDVEAEVLTANAALGTPSFEAVQVNGSTVSVSGTVLVSDLSGSPATVRVTVNAADACGNPGSAFADADVVDTTPPAISVALSPALLWPPNHRLREITATVEATDNCPGVGFALASVTSDEPDDAQGGGDGHTTGDIAGLQLGTDDVAFLLRAERLGAGDGRAYTVTYVATDGSGNEMDGAAQVVVPHAAAVFMP